MFFQEHTSRLKTNLVRKHKAYLLLLVVVAAILFPLVASDAYLSHLMIMVMIFSMLALSLDVIIGYMGQLSFGHQAFFGLGAYTTGVLTVKMGITPWVGFFAGIAFAALVGLCIGFISLKRTRGFFLAIITMGFGRIVWMIAMKWSNLSGGERGLPAVPCLSIWVPFAGRISLETESTYYYFVLAVLILTIYIIYVWMNSRLGKAVSAIRENEELATSIGIDPFKCYLAAFTLACALAGLAGVTYAHYMKLVGPIILTPYYMFWLVFMVLIGGMRVFAGPILGALLFVFLPELLVATEEYRMVIVGVVVLVCVIFMQQGIVPSLVEFWNRHFKPGAKYKIASDLDRQNDTV